MKRVALWLTMLGVLLSMAVGAEQPGKMQDHNKTMGMKSMSGPRMMPHHKMMKKQHKRHGKKIGIRSNKMLHKNQMH